MTEALKIYTLGKLAITQDGSPITGFNSRKSEVLVVYLACTRRSYLRETLAELLWEERTQAQSMANLRLVLSDLRQRVGSIMAITRQSVALESAAPLWVDALELEARLNLMNEQWTQSAALSQTAITQL